MLKGVNKLIIEINNPESEYFERAIFFIKPNKKDISASELTNSADRILHHNKYNSSYSKKKSKFFLQIVLMLIAASVGAVLFAFLSSYFG